MSSLKNVLRLVLAAAVVLPLAACENLPRGAGLQREVLAANVAATDTQTAARDFAIAPVTRALLPVYAAWPAVNGDARGWIGRVAQPANRIIAPGDSVTVTVFDTDENGLLTAPGQRSVVLEGLRVSPAGRIFLPYIGDIRISGMAPETARDRIQDRYAQTSPSVQVLLALAEGRQSTVALVSGVASPGVYPLPDGNFTVMGLIAVGGGVAADFDNPQIRLQRGDRIYATSLRRLLNAPGLDTTLRGGDKVFVEEDTRRFLSLGAAGTEAVHRFTDDHMTALQALAVIGGVTDARADPQGVLILRRYPAAAVRGDSSGPSQTRVVFTIDLTSADGLFSAGEFSIQPGDLIYATESPVTGAQTVLGLIGATFGLVTAAAAVGG